MAGIGYVNEMVNMMIGNPVPGEDARVKPRQGAGHQKSCACAFDLGGCRRLYPALGHAGQRHPELRKTIRKIRIP
jgi:hypothetical protein